MSIKFLSCKDFISKSITLKDYNLYIILFINNNQSNVIKEFIQVSKLIGGPIFAICNLINNNDIYKVFIENNHTNQFKLDESFILLYKNGWPIKEYYPNCNNNLSILSFISEFM